MRRISRLIHVGGQTACRICGGNKIRALIRCWKNPARSMPDHESAGRKRKETAMRRILVVDDDSHIGQAIEVWLKQHGFRVSTADSGPGGLAALDNASFDLMIVDVFMPHMRGFEAIRLFHERAPTVPLIAISGSAFTNWDISAPEFLRLAT